ncbi:MAG: hypothetical protein OXE02_05985 [Chloroflexi bacterium]|nr:hypothetical protein [Chloroflexota bacterium]
MSHPNDEVRQQILQYFYDRNENATSERRKRGSQIKISDIKKELKTKHGLTQSQVMSQLNYLISSEWVKKLTEERTYTTPRGTQQPSIKEWYTITSKGIDKIEGSSSEFMRESPYSHVNITALNSAVQLGNGNVVRESFVGLANELAELQQAIVESDFTEEEKVSSIADIETITDQLAKSAPNKSILRSAWEAITSSKAASLVQTGNAIAKTIEEVDA